MEQIRGKIRDASLKKTFICAVSLSVVLSLALSGAAIWLCTSFQAWLLPNPDEIYLTIVKTCADGTQYTSVNKLEIGAEIESIPLVQVNEYTADGYAAGNAGQDYEDVQYAVEKIERGADMLTPRRKAAYRCSQAAMFVLPLLYSAAAIVICALWFYKRKLETPIRILTEGSEHIAAQDLDFSMEYESADEMGQLCTSFENMRQALYENNRTTWSMIQERRLLWASVAHDLRNPIAVICGYAEHLQNSIASGRLGREKLEKISAGLMDAAKRLEVYTDSVRSIGNLEELEIRRGACALPEFLTGLAQDFSVVAAQKGIRLCVENTVPDCEVLLDRQVFCRICENIFANALRFAESRIDIVFSLRECGLVTEIADDGEGFPEKILNAGTHQTFAPDTKKTHMGMGLVISSILCRKHGGELKLANRAPSGAVVTIVIDVSENA